MAESAGSRIPDAECFELGSVPDVEYLGKCCMEQEQAPSSRFWISFRRFLLSLVAIACTVTLTVVRLGFRLGKFLFLTSHRGLDAAFRRWFGRSFPQYAMWGIIGVVLVGVGAMRSDEPEQLDFDNGANPQPAFDFAPPFGAKSTTATSRSSVVIKEPAQLLPGMFLKKLKFATGSHQNGFKVETRSFIWFTHRRPDGGLFFIDLRDQSTAKESLWLHSSDDIPPSLERSVFREAVLDSDIALPEPCRLFVEEVFEWMHLGFDRSATQFATVRNNQSDKTLEVWLSEFFDAVTLAAHPVTFRDVFIKRKLSSDSYEAALSERGEPILVRTKTTEFESGGNAYLPLAYLGKRSLHLENGFRRPIKEYEEREASGINLRQLDGQLKAAESGLLSSLRHNEISVGRLEQIILRMKAFVDAGPSKGTVLGMDLDYPPRRFYCSNALNFCLINWSRIKSR